MKIVNNFKVGDEVWLSICEFGASLSRCKTKVKPTKLIVKKRTDGLEIVSFHVPHCGDIDLSINEYTDKQLRLFYGLYRDFEEAKEAYNSVVLNRIDELSSALEKTREMLL